MAPKSRGSSRKVKDKWKSKEWYKLHAPRMFNEAEIGETPSADPSLLIGRTVEVTVQELTGDYSKMNIKLKFKVTDVDGYDAKTTFIGHELTSEYVRRLTRRKKTKTDHVVDVTTKDGFVLRVKPMSIADRRIQSSQEDAMRRILAETLVQMGKDSTLSDLIKSIISGEMSKDLAKACRIIIPIKRIEIRKTEVLSVGEGEPESIMEKVSPAEESESEEKETETPAVEEPVAEAPVEDEAPAEVTEE